MTTRRRDRTGEEIDPDAPEYEPHRCVRGWLGEDDLGRPKPCPTCKPELASGRTTTAPVPRPRPQSPHRGRVGS